MAEFYRTLVLNFTKDEVQRHKDKAKEMLYDPERMFIDDERFQMCLERAVNEAIENLSIDKTSILLDAQIHYVSHPDTRAERKNFIEMDEMLKKK